MLDTVILTFPIDKFEIFEPERFQPDARYILTGRMLGKAINNPKKEDYKKDYKPRLTLYKRISRVGFQIELRMEFSAPNILFNNNLDELEDENFSRVIELLHLKLRSMGVNISHENLYNASVSSFHASKNILLTGYYTSTFVIREFSKVNLTKRLDLTKTNFRNEGHSLQYYSNSHSLVFYDKIADLQKKKNRAIDKEKTAYQTELFRRIEVKRRENPIEILRMEVRLSKKQKMNGVLQKIGYKKNPTFQEIFNKELCKKIIQFYWKEMVFSENLFLFSKEENPQKILQNILKNDLQIRAKQAIYMTGLALLCRDNEGIREVRKVVESINNKRSWYVINSDIQNLNNYAKGKERYEFMKDIEQAIDKFSNFDSKYLKSEF